MPPFKRYDFSIPPLPKPLYAQIKALEQMTGRSRWELVVEALREYVARQGNIPSPLPVQTVQAPTPTPTIDYFPIPGEVLTEEVPSSGVWEDSAFNYAVMLRKGVLVNVRKAKEPDAAQESHPYHEDHDGARGSD